MDQEMKPLNGKKQDQGSQPFLLWVGGSQVGKSSCVKLLTEDQSIEIGDCGMSTTTKMKVHKELGDHKLGQNYLHMDTIGFRDNNIMLTDRTIYSKIEAEILKYSKEKIISSITAIIIVESISGDSIQLNFILKYLKMIFQQLPSKSIIVLGTKPNDQSVKKKQNIKKIMKENGIPESRFIEFATYHEGKSTHIPKDKFSQLSKQIKKCTPQTLENMNSKRQYILKSAKIIQGSKKSRIVRVAVKKQKVSTPVKMVSGVGVGGVGGGGIIYGMAKFGATVGSLAGPLGYLIGVGIGVGVGWGVGFLLSKASEKQVPPDYKQNPEIETVEPRKYSYYPSQQEAIYQALQDFEKHLKKE